MELQTNDVSFVNPKRWLRLITGLLIAFLVICTLLSNTLYALTLPKVTTQVVNQGALNQTFKGSNSIKPMEVRDVTGQAGWNVKKVLVRVGDVVQQGQPLVQYSNDEAEQQLVLEQAALDKLQLSVEKLEYVYIESERNEDKGAILTAKAALESSKIDISLQQKNILDLQAKLSSHKIMKAPFDGIVAAVNAKEGLSAGVGVPDIRLSNMQSGFQLELQIPTEIAESLTIDEVMDVHLPRQNNRVIQGKAASLVQADSAAELGTSRLTVLLQDPSLVSGERAEVTLTKKGKADTLLISSAAIRKDQTGTYVYTIEERKGPLGNAFYATRRTVTVDSSNENVAALSEGLFNQMAVIVESSEPLLEGSRVRVLTK
ncbi:efflux RND transporter periplasmic adaptor subunit [Paenibacillus alba]|uniref:Efflux RND transporter periplasmic adaptor subunit n=1 Tax=Paenibacillus alba TaxID=1197127 RepID=A0ABU6GHE0_9BACL|nr:efflux RND transporter periplasmic adaptor subunit [Paenibacillus alba]MEC0232138.1 efflux RND transporter periplasmic adaptor subunit [Paenibacillus alba]